MTTRYNKRGILKLPKKREKELLTVCIAVIYNDNAVLGASDRMLTGGDIQFEPPARKIFPVTKSIAIMTAGDASIQAQLIERDYNFVKEKVEAEPNNWISVEEVAKNHRDSYIRLRRERAEIEILAPYNLDYQLFLDRQDDLSDDFVRDISYKLENFTLVDEDVASIITGVDDTGPHIYVVSNDHLSSSDTVGFAAVGIGRHHSLSHLMLAKHSRNTPEAKALLSLHRAKKKAEVSPGVGEETDMFVAGPNKGTFNWLVPTEALKVDIVSDLDGFYDSYKTNLEAIDKADEQKVQDYLSKLVKDNQPQSKDQEVEPPPALDVSVSDKTSVKGSSSVKKEDNKKDDSKKEPPKRKSRKTN